MLGISIAFSRSVSYIRILYTHWNPWQHSLLHMGLQVVHNASRHLGYGQVANITKQLARETSTLKLGWLTQLSPIIVGAAVAYFAYKIVRHVCSVLRDRHVPHDTEGLGHPHLMVEVTQQEAQATPTHFACPALLRAHILERIMLCDRTPQLIQKCKSICGRWCDDNGIAPALRPAYIAGGLACAMSVSNMELDLISYERAYATTHARLQVRRHANADIRPAATDAFWQWLMRPGRR